MIAIILICYLAGVHLAIEMILADDEPGRYTRLQVAQDAPGTHGAGLDGSGVTQRPDAF